MNPNNLFPFQSKRGAQSRSRNTSEMKLKASLQNLPAPKPTPAQFAQALPLNLRPVALAGPYLAWRGIDGSRGSWFKKSILLGVTVTLLTLALWGANFYSMQQDDELNTLDDLSVASMLLI